MNLLELVDAGDTAGVLRELEAMTPDQRAAYAPELAARREALITGPNWWMVEYNGNVHETARCTAELGCRTTPQAAAAWLAAHQLQPATPDWMLDVVNLYPTAWRIELVTQVVAQASPNPRAMWFPITEHLVRTTGCPVPTSDVFIQGWLLSRLMYPARMQPGHRLDWVQGANYLERLRNDEFTPLLLPLAVERPSVAILTVEPLTALAADGVIDRAVLINRVFADAAGADARRQADMLNELALTAEEHARTAPQRAELAELLLTQLLQDGTPNETGAPRAALRALGLAPDENAAFLRDHVAMLDLSSPVADYGQEILIALEEAGLLEADVLTETCERVLLRPEKKLVRAQLSWLDRIARRDPARAGRVLADAAMAFQHPDVALQERALKLIARHLRNADADVLPELRAAAAGISPGLADRAAEVLGAPEDAGSGVGAGQYTETLPAAPEPRSVPGPIETAAEVAQEVAAVLAHPDDVVAFERALDGLVRHARLGRGALAAALAPAVRREPQPRHTDHGFTRIDEDYSQVDLYDVAAAVCGDERRRWHIHLREDEVANPFIHIIPKIAEISPPGRMLQARLSEAIELVESGSQPSLLALPTVSTGAIDAAVLVERIAGFEASGADPAPVDLAQALLRVGPAPDGPVLRAAEKLRSGAGRRLARWLRNGGLPHRDSAPPQWPVSDPARRPLEEWRPVARPGPVTDPALPPVAAALIGLRRCTQWESGRAGPFWMAQLPHHRDEVAARAHLPLFGDTVAPFLADAGGPAGFAVHWHVADGLRSAADPLLMLAAQGQLDSALLGGLLQAMLRHRESEAKPVTATLHAATETGAHATVWSVLAAALPGLLRGTPVRGAGALLALAAECASRCGATGPIPEVDAVAGRKGSSQTIKNARLLRDALR
ncbi:DUF6493 family protein [Streptomonospora sediminis]